MRFAYAVIAGLLFGVECREVLSPGPRHYSKAKPPASRPAATPQREQARRAYTKRISLYTAG